MDIERDRRLRLLRESFVPVIMVFLALFSLLLYVYFKAEFEAEKVTVIDVGPDVQDVAGLSAAGTAMLSAVSDMQTDAETEKQYLARLSGQAGSAEYSALGALYLKRGDLVKAKEFLNRAAEMKPVAVEAYTNRALLFSRIGQPQQALDDYLAAQKIAPGHFASRFNAGMLQLALNDPLSALASFEAAARNARGKNKAQALFGQGNAWRMLNDRARAMKAYEEAQLAASDYIEPRMALGELTVEHDKDAALRQFNAVLELRPNYPPALIQIASILVAKKKPVEAEAAYRRAIQFDPQNESAHFGLGSLLIREKRWSEATAEYEWLLERNPGQAEAQFSLGRIGFGRKDYDQSIAAYRVAIGMRNGEYPEAWLNLGLAHAAKKDYPAALDAYRKALKHRRQYPEAWYNIGFTLLRQKDYVEAEQAFQSAIRLKPDYEQAWFNLGVIFSATERDAQAIDAYEKALRIRPDYQQAKLNLAVRQSRVGKQGEAIRLYRELLAEDDSYALAWSNLGALYRATGQETEAVAALRKVVELNPGDGKALFRFGSALLAVRQTREAVRVLEDAVASDQGEARYRLELARALRQDGRVDEARAELDKVRQLDPQLDGINEVAASLATGK